MKRILSLVLTLAMVLSILPTGLFGITANAATSGTTGDCTWSLNGTVLTISGYGRMANYTYSSRAPWANNGITKVVIRDGVTNIGDYAFYNHTYLASISIPDSVTSIGDSAFMDCSSLISVEFPDGLTSIGKTAFCNDNITSVTIPDSVTYIGGHAFAYNDFSSIVIPSKVTAIAENTFYACKSLTSVTMHDGIVSIGNDAFAYNNLSKIIIPDSVTYIGDNAFMWNEGLYAVTIGANVNTIRTNAFRGCSSLTSVYYRGSQAEKSNISIYSYNTDLTNATWYYNSCIGTNYHTYANDCDAECNVCSFTREAHNYTNDCDKDCNICGFIRVPSDHIYDNSCDRACNVCGEERKITHTYSDDSDKSCDICGQIRGPYTITYHLDGGTNAVKNPDVYTEEDTIILKNASKVGYDFAGWFLDANKTEPVTEIYMMGNLELYAKFLPKSYNVTFDSNGAEKSGQITITLHTGITSTKKTVLVNNGDSFSPYDYWQPKVSGYVFAGWMHNSKLIGNQIEITEDIDLYAKWVENPKGYPVLGEDVTSISAYSNEKYFYISCNYTRIYYKLTAQKKYTEVLSPTTHLVQYRYSASSSSSISANGLSVSLPGYTTVKNGAWQEEDYVTLEPGTLVRISNSRSGDLDHFSIGGGVTVETTVRTTYNNTITVSEKRTQSQEYDSVINAPSVSKTGYEFLGWYDSQGNQMKDTWQYTEDQTFTAKWQLVGYEITYELDGGINNSSNPAGYTREDTITLKDPTKPGYTFQGWYSDANFTTPITVISQETGNMTLYAKWEVNSYNLTLDANDGNFAPKVTFISDGVEIKSCYLYSEDTITAYRPNNKEGYIFAGWYEDDIFTSLFKFDKTITDDTTLYARWIECDNNVVNVESVGSVNVVVAGKTEKLYAFVPLADGNITVTSVSNNKDLYGILYDSNKNILISADDISDSDLDFSYTYDVKAGQMYYISIKGNTASTSGAATVNIQWTGSCAIMGTTYQNRQVSVVYDSEYQLPVKPVREGYAFLGWYDEGNRKISDGVWKFVTDKSLTAKWEEATYHTVVFKDLAGNIISSETYYLTEDLVAPELPTKAPDEKYIYHPKWDNDYSGVCTGDAVYTPIFETEYIDYTVTFKDWNGGILSEKTYHYGDEVTAPMDPTKVADNTYSYAFVGWDKAVVNCAGDAIYTATYTPVYIDYTVEFKDWNGDVLSSKTYHYGDQVIAPADPAKPADNTYTYSFAGWDKEVVDCAGNATYTATYKSAYIDYTVIFADEDGTEISRNTYHWGDRVTAPKDPVKAADDTYTYTFAGWDKEVVNCAGDVTYTATYAPVYIDYTVEFKDWNGDVISSKSYHWGDAVVVPSDPIRTADNACTYTFAGWDKAVVNCAGNATYTATYTPTYIDYTVTFKNWDGTVLSAEVYHWGDVITVPATPTREGNETLRYVFAGWDTEVTNCTGDATYTATYTSIDVTYTVIFVNEDGTELSRNTYHWGDAVTIPADPAKAADNTYIYAFASWDKEIVPCAGDATYTAVYTATYIDYTVIFVDEDGTELSRNIYNWGDPVTVPADPSKAADNTYTYTFAGWGKTVVNCAGDATYTAQYTRKYINYTVKFVNWNGDVIASRSYHWGDAVYEPWGTPSKAADEDYTYTFAGWDQEIVPCAGDATYTAIFTATYKPVVSVYAGDQVAVKYNSLAEAMASVPADSSDYIHWFLLRDVKENITITKNTFLYLDGNDLVGNITVTDGVWLRVADRATDDYTVEDGEGYGKIVGTVEGTVIASYNYLMITEKDGISFHRYSLDITDMTLRASEAGVYYKSSFSTDEVIARNVDRYGVSLTLGWQTLTDENPGICSWYEDSFVAGEDANSANGTLLYGIMKTTNSDAENESNASRYIRGSAYIRLKDGSYIFDSATSRTFREQVELADAQWEELTEVQRSELIAMYNTYAEVMKGWNIPNTLQAAK